MKGEGQEAVESNMKSGRKLALTSPNYTAVTVDCPSYFVAYKSSPAVLQTKQAELPSHCRGAPLWSRDLSLTTTTAISSTTS